MTTATRAARFATANGLEVSAYGYLSGQVRDPNACTHAGWTDDRVKILKVEWATGKSASQIAKVLGGVTRNSVIGKVNRLGLAGRKAACAPRMLAPTAASKPRAIKGAFVLPSLKNAPGNPFENAIAAATQNAMAREIPDPDDNVVCDPRIWTDRNNGCNWVVSGRGADSMACCNKVHARGWCKAHYKLGVGGKATSEKELARSLRRYL